MMPYMKYENLLRPSAEDFRSTLKNGEMKEEAEIEKDAGEDMGTDMKEEKKEPAPKITSNEIGVELSLLDKARGLFPPASFKETRGRKKIKKGVDVACGEGPDPEPTDKIMWGRASRHNSRRRRRGAPRQARGLSTHRRNHGWNNSCEAGVQTESVGFPWPFLDSIEEGGLWKKRSFSMLKGEIGVSPPVPLKLCL